MNNEIQKALKIFHNTYRKKNNVDKTILKDSFKFVENGGGGIAISGTLTVREKEEKYNGMKKGIYIQNKPK